MKISHYRDILAHLRSIIDGTRFDNHVFAVGGCCRDEIRGTDINDVDLAVNLPDGGIEFARWLFENGYTTAKPVEFSRYCTAMLRLKSFPDDEIEIVQTRKGKYSVDDGHEVPSSAVFGSVSDDAMRRDLTINTLYCDITTGQILDLTGKALDDIKNHILRTPMAPELTFDDDAVRVLRCIRLSSKLGWKIDEDTFKAIAKYANSLKSVKVERIRAEFEKMLCGPHPDDALRMLRSSSVADHVLHGFALTFRTYIGDDKSDTLWRRMLSAMRYLAADSSPLADDLHVRWAVVLYCVCRARCKRKTDRINPCSDLFVSDQRKAASLAHEAGEILLRLHEHSQMRHSVAFLVRNASATLQWGDSAQKAKDRQLSGLRRLCGDERRLMRLLAVIDALNHTGPAIKQRPVQVNAIRARLSEKKLAPAQSERRL